SGVRFLVLLQFYAALQEHLAGELVRVALAVDHAGNAGIDDHLRADDAGLVRAVERGVLNGHAQLRRLDDGVLLGVDGVAKLVPRARGDALLFAHALAALNAGADARGRAVVAGGEYALVFDDHRADLAVGLIAAGPGGDE